jgi:hypothetical protein
VASAVEDMAKFARFLCTIWVLMESPPVDSGERLIPRRLFIMGHQAAIGVKPALPTGPAATFIFCGHLDLSAASPVADKKENIDKIITQQIVCFRLRIFDSSFS